MTVATNSRFLHDLARADGCDGVLADRAMGRSLAAATHLAEPKADFDADDLQQDAA